MEGAGPDTGAVPSLRATAALSLFDSPALGLRLFSGRARRVPGAPASTRQTPTRASGGRMRSRRRAC